MTPCEKLGYKVGDRFEVIGEGASDPIEVGDIITLYRDDGSYVPFFQRDGEEFDHDCAFLSSLRPLNPQTEAEKRGAKFGTMGVIKATGERAVFHKEGGVIWYLLTKGSRMTLTYAPSEIRLDHEPEYKEIPFSEATHEQRMEKDCVEWRGHTVSEIVPFKNGSYGWTIGGKPDIMWNTDGLTVRIPT